MFSYSRPGQWVRDSFGLIILFFSAQALAADNIWESTFGQRWFYEVRSYSGEVIAGTWWEHSLTPGNTYQITFDVKNVQGRIGLMVGNNPAVTISKPGTYSFDFNVWEGSKRRMIFQTLSDDVVASVNGISVTRKWESSSKSDDSGSNNWIPKGHYLSFDRARNLEADVVKPMETPWAVNSNWARNIAEDLDAAFRTPGVKGIYMAFDWRTVEVGDGKYNWWLMDANMRAARKYGLKLIVKISDRSFNGTNIMPGYFPSRYVLWTEGGGKKGFTAKRWDPYVYNRMIRLYKAIAHRYAAEPAFGGIATTETATGNFSGGDYSIREYRTALTQIVTQTQAALTRGKLFFYLNFLRGGDDSNMNEDVRVDLLRDVPHRALVVGAPDITPDVSGMPRSVSNYRVHARKHMPALSQFCHLQHVDHGERGINVKSNEYRREYFDEVARVRHRETQSWFQGKPAVFEFDDLRDPKGNKVSLHPQWVLGKLWTPHELFSYGQRNFGCDYVFWHWREYAGSNEFAWTDVRPVVLNNQYLD